MTSDQAAILALIDERVAAIHAHDAARANATLHPDLVSFEFGPPLAVSGQAARDDAGLDAWFASWEEGPRIDARDVRAFASGDVGFVHAFHRLSGTREGAATSLWFRSTLCLVRDEAGWRIVHSHSSVPFRAGDGFRAAFDLEPGAALAPPGARD